MKENVFRGKTTAKGKWAYGSLVNGYDSSDEKSYIVVCIKLDEEESDELHFAYKSNEVDPATVGQYTGIDDRNGKRIFEGDIIRTIAEGEEETYAVEWRGDDRYPAFDLQPQPDCERDRKRCGVIPRGSNEREVDAMNLKAHITGKAKSVEHPGQIVDIDRDLDGDGIICFALRDVSSDETMIGMVTIGEFSIRDLSYMFNALKEEFGEDAFRKALLREYASVALDEKTII